MDSQHSTTLLFRLTDDAVLRELVLVLTAVFHVVPSEVPDVEGHVLSVEVDGHESADLVADVRRLVVEGDPGSAELSQAHSPEGSVSG